MIHKYTDGRLAQREDDKAVATANRADVDMLKAKVEKLEKPK